MRRPGGLLGWTPAFRATGQGSIPGGSQTFFYKKVKLLFFPYFKQIFVEMHAWSKEKKSNLTYF